MYVCQVGQPQQQIHQEVYGDDIDIQTALGKYTCASLVCGWQAAAE